jgi:hypothetical protein
MQLATKRGEPPFLTLRQFSCEVLSALEIAPRQIVSLLPTQFLYRLSQLLCIIRPPPFLINW